MTSQLRILRAARELFGTQGFEATSVRQLAAACGLTDAAVLYHFGSKEGILEALWAQETTVNTAEVAPVSGALPARVDALVASMLHEAARRDAEIRLTVRQALAGDSRAAEVRTAAVRAWRSAAEACFQRECPPGVAQRMADALVMLVVGVILRAQSKHGPSFAAVCRSRDFQSHAQRLARIATGLTAREGW